MIPTCQKLTPLAALLAVALVAGCGRNDVAPSAGSGTGMSETGKASTGDARSAAEASTASQGTSTVPGSLSTAGAASGGNAGPAGGITTKDPGTVTGMQPLPSAGGSPAGASDTPQSPGTGHGTERSGDNKKGAGLGAGTAGHYAAAGPVAVTMALTPTQATAPMAGSPAAPGAGPAASGSTMQSAGGVTSPHGGIAGERLPAPADRSFMNNAAIGGVFEVAVGKVAAERAGDAKVKDFGNMLVEDHTKANEELAALATARGIKPPTKLPAAKQAKIDRLAKLSGRNFDRQFLQQVGVKDHQEDIRLFEKAAKSARDPEVKAFATKTLPTLRKHHQEAQDLLRSANAAGGRRAAETQQR